VLLLVVPLVVLALASGASAARPVLQPSAVLDGPSADVGTLGGLSMASDGTGGLVYLKLVAGVEHVFVSSLASGAFGKPQQVDPALAGPSSQPVIGASSNGLLLIAFVNGDQLYVVTRPSSTAPYGSPQPLAGGASNPAIAVSVNGKGYLAFTAFGSGGHDVRCAYYHAGQWATEPSPLDAVPADDAGTGVGRPRVAAAGDGVGIVVWGEAGHVYSRRVWATSPSVVFEQADVPTFAGANEVAAGLPAIAAGDDSSYATVALQEQFAGTAGVQSRILVRRLRGSLYESAVAADGLTPTTPDNAVNPQVVETGVDSGLLTSGRLGSNQVVAAQLGQFGNAGAISSAQRVDTLPNASPPQAVPATTGSYSGLVAWQHDPGLGPREIRARFYSGSSSAPEMAVSSPTLGPTNAANGLAAGGDIAGDLAVAWIQGSFGFSAIVAAQLYAPPGGFGLTGMPKYIRQARPSFRWSPSQERWGPVRYTVSVDGAQAAPTAATSWRLPQPLAEGPHILQVTAVNQANLTAFARPLGIWVDTIPPRAQLTLSGVARARSIVRIKVRYTDTTPPTGRVGSGVASVIVKWGDGATARIGQVAAHAYARQGRYAVTVIVTDRAGNAVRLSRRIRIAARRR
jgi:PKD domain